MQKQKYFKILLTIKIQFGIKKTEWETILLKKGPTFKY